MAPTWAGSGLFEFPTAWLDSSFGVCYYFNISNFTQNYSEMSSTVNGGFSIHILNGGFSIHYDGFCIHFLKFSAF